jgi:hypothetical protein
MGNRSCCTPNIPVCALSNEKESLFLVVFGFQRMTGVVVMGDDLFQFPITGWEIKTEPVDGLLSVRFPFLSHEQQKLAEADPGRPYVMQAEQARELRDALSRAIERLEDQELATPMLAETYNPFLIY